MTLTHMEAVRQDIYRAQVRQLAELLGPPATVKKLNTLIRTYVDHPPVTKIRQLEDALVAVLGYFVANRDLTLAEAEMVIGTDPMEDN